MINYNNQHSYQQYNSVVIINPSAKVPNYVLTTDNVGTYLAVDCTVMDDNDRQMSILSVGIMKFLSVHTSILITYFALFITHFTSTVFIFCKIYLIC